MLAVFVHVCLYVLCGHLLGKGWPLGSRSWCLLWVCHFPIGILSQVWYLIVSIPDLCTLTYLKNPLNIDLGTYKGEWPKKLFLDQSPRKYGTGPGSNSRPLDLKSDVYLQSDMLVLRYAVGRALRLKSRLFCQDESLPGLWDVDFSALHSPKRWNWIMDMS